jgi:hypothetical protein
MPTMIFWCDRKEKEVLFDLDKWRGNGRLIVCPECGRKLRLTKWPEERVVDLNDSHEHWRLRTK